MKNRPASVIIVATLFILAGSIGIVYHFSEFYGPGNELYEVGWVLILRIVAVVCGVMMLFRISFSRWLAILWLAYHVYVSAFNSISEMITHIILLLLISTMLFLPASWAYFHNRKKQ